MKKKESVIPVWSKDNYYKRQDMLSSFSVFPPPTLGELKPITLMCEPCSGKTSSKLLFDHSAALSATQRDTGTLLHIL
jgi:hypothetical protein